MPRHEQLLLVKNTLVEAEAAISRGGTYASLHGVILLDLAVEMLLGSIAADFSAPSPGGAARRDISWADAWLAADAAAQRKTGGSALPEARRLRDLHEIRNLAQHRGVIPFREELDRLVEPARAFVTYCFRSVYGFDLDRFAPWSLVGSDHLRGCLEDGADALAAGRPVLAMVAAKRTYEAAVRAVVEVEFGSAYKTVDDVFRRALHSLDRDVRRAVEPVTQEVAEGIDEVLDVVRADVLHGQIGVRLSEVRRFRETGAAIRFHAYGDGEIQLTRAPVDPDPDLHESARQMLDFATSCVLRLEAAYPATLAAITFKKRLRDTGLWREA